MKDGSLKLSNMLHDVARLQLTV